MARWKIGICGRAQVESDIEVEAETQAEAEELALGEARADVCCWEISDGFITDPEVVDVEQLAPEEEERA